MAVLPAARSLCSASNETSATPPRPVPPKRRKSRRFRSQRPAWLSGAEGMDLPLLRQRFRRRRLRDEPQSFLDQDFTGFLPEARARDIAVDFETAPIDAGENVTERIVRKAKEQVVFAPHVALEIEADVRERLP